MDFSTRHFPSFWNATNRTQANSIHCACSLDVREPESVCDCSDDVTTSIDSSAAFLPWDNPANLISRDTVVTLEKVVTCGLNPLLLAVGLPSNVLNALVFKRQGLGDRMNVSLFSLELVDLFCVVFWFLLGSFCLVGHAVPSDPVIMEWWKWIVRKYIRGGSVRSVCVCFLYMCTCVSGVRAGARLSVCFPLPLSVCLTVCLPLPPSLSLSPSVSLFLSLSFSPNLRGLYRCC